jgi:hypothetical protein
MSGVVVLVSIMLVLTYGKSRKKSRQQSYLRRDRHSAVSGADGAVYAAVCNRCVDPIELISKKLKYNSETD